MPSEEDNAKFLLELLIEIGDDRDSLARFRKTGNEVLQLSGIWNYHKKKDANDLAAIVLSELIEWITFDRQSTLWIAFNKLASYVQEQQLSDPEELFDLAKQLEKTFSEMREVWKRTKPDLTSLIPPDDDVKN